MHWAVSKPARLTAGAPVVPTVAEPAWGEGAVHDDDSAAKIGNGWFVMRVPAIASMSQPLAPTAVSVPIRKRSWTDCPASCVPKSSVNALRAGKPALVPLNEVGRA